MYLNKRDSRRDYSQQYGDRDRMMYDNRARGRDPGVINRSAPYTGNVINLYNITHNCQFCLFISFCIYFKRTDFHFVFT